ncbi:ATP-dependent zinc metalloprotease FtsH [Rhodoblastus acidophilus]|uniref:ATP-dependent zinc metalloprotease FtsH n=1 Tax=Candidatus Rhodoblastus alkanivorans TaxID=2954117 RepID=A0ABS9Z7X1_9HYPH|nr:ATP-dependent zinc metalloprotease FtsH [Candidatus Rhodoblastus alkanivorans]MCI4678729.1 ATP-dependent zinc metalloprotease FtsH [Candidatus Rhodoblastus alkanivorans]MCI4683475.1 ATP-dependent zinc metalloprotease FtsH [Candidatus Rhodoblastus alkanivorans]MDI4640789.1 ATP-dependent zinc metalloprotease FtsH [Rhodoblastus acidophilus]
MDKRQQWHFWYWMAALFGVVLIAQTWAAADKIASVPYSQFLDDLHSGKIAEVRVSGDYIQGKWKKAEKDGVDQFVTTRVAPELAAELQRNHVKFSGAIESHFLSTLLSWVVPTALFFGLWMFWFRRMAADQGGVGGLMSIGRSKAKVYVETNTKTTFKDVAGADEAKAELEEIVDFLKNPKEYGRLGARMPKGVLLIGPPGTGKTLLGRAVAGEAGVPFFSINGSEFVEMFVGVGAARVRDLFEQASQKAPAIIFIDELDALGRARGAYPYMGHDEKEQTLNQLLVELDGFDSRSGLVLLAATNRPEILDPALLRAGRFDRQVLVDRPDKGGRIEIVNLYLKGHKLGPDVSAEKIASLTPGFTGADLANLVNEAALVATRRDAEEIAMSDFTEGVERMVAGLEKKKRVLSPKEREFVAYHEMGHALVAMSLPRADVVHKVSIIPRGIGALGYTIQRPTEDRYVITQDELLDKMTVLLGGRAAEWTVFHHLSTGAADDLAKVTDIARDMVTRFGMESRLGPVSYESAPSPFLNAPPGFDGFHQRRYSDETAHAIDEAVQKIVAGAFDRTVAILAGSRATLERGAKLLLERETLDEAALKPLRDEMRAAGAVAAQ